MLDPTTTNSNITDTMNRLNTAGAVPVIRSFNVAAVGQEDIVFNEHRYLITANDENYRRYVELLSKAALPYIVNDPSLGDAEVVVGEITRDARTLPQIMRSTQSEGGMTSKDVFYRTGQMVGALATATGYIPDAKGFSINRTLILRDAAEIMLVPPVDFVPVDDDNKRQLLERVQQELWPEYARFGAIVLFNAFEQGLES